LNQMIMRKLTKPFMTNGNERLAAELTGTIVEELALWQLLFLFIEVTGSIVQNIYSGCRKQSNIIECNIWKRIRFDDF
jgi:hypothetical protein